MNKELLIASLIIIIVGFAISGVIGSIILGVGILLLIYVLFSRGSSPSEARYIEPPYNPNRKTEYREPVQPPERKSSAKYVEEPGPKYKNVDRAERELKAWGSGSGKKCSSCGSTSNPANAKFCADCGKKL